MTTVMENPVGLQLMMPPGVQQSLFAHEISSMKITISNQYDTHPPPRPYTQAVSWVMKEYENACKSLNLSPSLYMGQYHMSRYRPNDWNLGSVLVSKTTMTFYNTYGNEIIRKYNHDSNCKNEHVGSRYSAQDSPNPPPGWSIYKLTYSCHIPYMTPYIAFRFNPQSYHINGEADVSSLITLPTELLQMIISYNELNWFDFWKMAIACPRQFRQVMMRYVQYHISTPGKLLSVLEWKHNKSDTHTHNDRINDTTIAVDPYMCLVAAIGNSNRQAYLWDLATGVQLACLGCECTAVHLYNPQLNGQNRRNQHQRQHMQIRRFIKKHCKGVNKEQPWFIVIGRRLDVELTLTNYRKSLLNDIQISKTYIIRAIKKEQEKHHVGKTKNTAEQSQQRNQDHEDTKPQPTDNDKAWLKWQYSKLIKANKLQSTDIDKIPSYYHEYSTMMNFIPLEMDPKTGFARPYPVQVIAPVFSFRLTEKTVEYAKKLMYPSAQSSAHPKPKSTYVTTRFTSNNQCVLRLHVSYDIENYCPWNNDHIKMYRDFHDSDALLNKCKKYDMHYIAHGI